MNTNAFPTKGNLMLAKNSLTLAKQGYELMDKKRNILIRELMNLIEEAKTIQSEIDATFTEAYQALQQANIEVGIHSGAGNCKGDSCRGFCAYQNKKHHGHRDPAGKLRGGEKNPLLRLL